MIRRWSTAGVAALLGMTALAGCLSEVEGDVRGGDDRAEVTSGSPAPDPELVAAALRFGELRLPPSATVVWAGTERGIDRLYTLVVELDPAEVDQLLAGSGFTAELREQRPVPLAAPPGYDPAGAEDFASGEDRLDPTDDHPEVFRRVLVDRDDPDRTRAYWWLFTT